MATPQDTTAFFQKANSKQFDSVLKLYPQALKLKAEQKTKKPEELLKLDNWYQNELPKKIKSRGKDAHIVHEELVQLMKWKQSRGKFYPQLSYLVKVNTPRAVMAETKRAFKKLPNIEMAITALSNLKGIGTATASALLAAANPDIAPFMADECLHAIPEMEGIDYTAKEYLNFVSHVRAVCDRLNQETNGCEGKWSPHRVELAVWTHSIVSDLRPELLDDDRCSPLPSEDSNLEPPITNGKISAEASDSCTEDSLDKAVSAEGSSPHTPPTPNTAEDTCDSFISNNDNAKRSAEGSSAEENSLGADSLEAAPVAKKARAESH